MQFLRREDTTFDRKTWIVEGPCVYDLKGLEDLFFTKIW